MHNTLQNKIFKTTDKNLIKIMDQWKSAEEIKETDLNAEEYILFKDLQKNGLIIENNYDEFAVVNYRYQKMIIQESAMGVIILPTRNCNFRCPYCYEEHENKTMSKETYCDVGLFLSKYIKQNNIKKVNISWFGGEPLLEYNNICWFMNFLKESIGNDVILTGSMTTNGYLLTKEKMLALLKLNIIYYQITIDGPKPFHNKTRYLSGGIGTWDEILNNLFDIKQVSEPFKIVLRTNFTEELLGCADEWLKYLSLNFGEDKRFEFHFETVRNLGKDNSYVNSDSLFFEKITTACQNVHLTSDKMSNFVAPFSMICYASDLNSFVIDYDGSLKKCSVCLDSSYNTIGNIKENGESIIDEEMYAWWTTYEIKEECKKCKIYPICFGKKCPNNYFDHNFCRELYEMYKSCILTDSLWRCERKH